MQEPKDFDMEEQNGLVTDNLPPDLREALNKLDSTPEKRTIAAYISSTSMLMSASPQYEAYKKVTSEHFSQMLDNEATRDKYAFELETQYLKNVNHNKIFTFFVVMIFLVFILLLILLLKDNPGILGKVFEIGVPALCTLIGGLATGYSAGYSKGKKERDTE